MVMNCFSKIENSKAECVVKVFKSWNVELRLACSIKITRLFGTDNFWKNRYKPQISALPAYPGYAVVDNLRKDSKRWPIQSMHGVVMFALV